MELPGADRALQAGSALWALLPKLIPLAYRVARLVQYLIIASALAAVVTLLATLVIDTPSTPAPVVAFVLFAALLAAPPLVLRLFHRALLEVLALPEWLRSSPEVARRHAVELAGLVQAAHGDPSALPATEGSRRRLRVRDVSRAGRLLLDAHGDLPEYGRALRLLNPVFLLVVAVAVVAAVFEILLAGTTVLLAVAVRLFS
jgi:hypothetical protein